MKEYEGNMTIYEEICGKYVDVLDLAPRWRHIRKFFDAVNMKEIWRYMKEYLENMKEYEEICRYIGFGTPISIMGLGT